MVSYELRSTEGHCRSFSVVRGLHPVSGSTEFLIFFKAKIHFFLRIAGPSVGVFQIRTPRDLLQTNLNLGGDIMQRYILSRMRPIVVHYEFVTVIVV